MSNRRKATPTELEFITAARGGDRDRLHDALVEMQRDPKRWFCSFAAMIKERPDALAMTAEPFNQIHIAWIMGFMAKNRLPASGHRVRGWYCMPALGPPPMPSCRRFRRRGHAQKTSGPPSSGRMKPNPRSVLKNFTRPVGIF